MTLLDHPLPIAFLIYITLCSIIIYVKPRILFTTTNTPKSKSHSNTDTDTDTETNTNEIIAHKTIWLFFILLAILVYSLVSIFISHTNRNNFLLQLK